MSYPGNLIGCRIYRNATTTLTTAVTATLSFTTTRWDTDVMWSGGAPTRITFNRAGKYIVGAHVSYAANATGIRTLNILKNGTDFIAARSIMAASSGLSNLSVCTVAELAAGNYIEITVHQNSGGDLDIGAGTSAQQYLADVFAHRLPNS